MTDYAMNSQKSYDALWGKFSVAVNKLQDFTWKAGLRSSTKELLQQIPLDDLGLDEDGEGVSIIYRPYNSHARNKLLIYNSRPHSSSDEDVNKPDFHEGHDYLVSLMNSNENNAIILPDDKCDLIDAGFPLYKSVMIIPIHLDYKNGINVGLFIVHHAHKECAYDQEILNIWKVFVGRIAFYVQALHLKRRDELSDISRNRLLKKLNNNEFSSEDEIIVSIVDQIRGWYKEDKIYILMKDLMNTEQYVLAYDGGLYDKEHYKITNKDLGLVERFRKQSVVSKALLTEISGNEENLLYLRQEINNISERGKILSSADMKTQRIGDNCQAWMGISFFHPSGLFMGAIILHNNTPNAYGESELRFVSAIADLAGNLLAIFRATQKEELLDSIKYMEFERGTNENNEKL
jgi:hypothetical protein